MVQLFPQVSIERVVVISEVTADTCRHTITGDVTVRMPGIGRMVERYVMTNTVAAMNMLHVVVDRSVLIHRCHLYTVKHHQAHTEYCP